MPNWREYAEYARSLESVSERETPTQLVFSLSGSSFCWVSKTNGAVQLIPALGKAPNSTRTLQRSGKLTLCIRSSNCHVDAEYDDPDGVLKPLWSYVGFGPNDCSTLYGFNLSKQAYEQASGPKRSVTKSVLTWPTTPPKPDTRLMPAATSEPAQPLEVMVKDVVLKLEGILQNLEPKAGRELSEWISDVQRKNLVPRPIADMMHTIRKIRNSVVHSNYSFGKHERAVLDSAWLTVKEWWEQRQVS